MSVESHPGLERSKPGERRWVHAQVLSPLLPPLPFPAHSLPSEQRNIFFSPSIPTLLTLFSLFRFSLIPPSSSSPFTIVLYVNGFASSVCNKQAKEKETRNGGHTPDDVNLGRPFRGGQCHSVLHTGMQHERQ